jgi:hypothetical protein
MTQGGFLSKLFLCQCTSAKVRLQSALSLYNCFYYMYFSYTGDGAYNVFAWGVTWGGGGGVCMAGSDLDMTGSCLAG